MHDQPHDRIDSANPESHDRPGEGRSGLRAAIERGLDDIKAGRVVDLDEALERIEAMLDELEAAKRPDV